LVKIYKYTSVLEQSVDMPEPVLSNPKCGRPIKVQIWWKHDLVGHWQYSCNMSCFMCVHFMNLPWTNHAR